MQIIDGILDSIFSYRGIVWINDKDLCIKLGRNEGYVYECKIKGKSYKEIIDSILDKEYRGVKWYSDSDLSIQLGKAAPYVKRHLAVGETRKQIIDNILDKQLCNVN